MALLSHFIVLLSMTPWGIRAYLFEPALDTILNMTKASSPAFPMGYLLPFS